MLNIRKSLKEQEELLIQAEKIISSELTKLPYGKIHCSRTKNGFKYYYKAEEDSAWVYLSTSKLDLAKALAQKEYYLKIQPIIGKQLRILRQLKKLYESDVLENVYGRFCPGRKALVKPLFLPADELIEKWENVHYEPKPFAEDQKGYITLRGERVRSKSEKIIADELYAKGIPYLYEYPLKLMVNGKEITFRPDFLVLNKRSGQRYIIEHLGMMDDMGYYNDTLRKLDVFEQNNLLIGRDVLLFHESQTRPLNIMVVRKYIEEYLI